MYDYPVAAGAPHQGPGELIVAPIKLEVPPGKYEVSFGFWTADRRRLYVDQANDIYWLNLNFAD